MSRECPVKESELEDRGLSEDELIGEHKDDVPKLPFGRLCNAMKTENGTGKFLGYCRAFSGQGTDQDDGRCKNHFGGSKVGAPEHNQHNRTHGMSADPMHYAESLDEEEQAWVQDMTATICDRVRANTGNVDPLDRTLARRLAIRLHIASRASEYVRDNGMIETIWTDEGRQDVRNRLLEELRQFDKDIVNDLKKIGVLDDPESQKADALAEWKSYVEQGH